MAAKQIAAGGSARHLLADGTGHGAATRADGLSVIRDSLERHPRGGEAPPGDGGPFAVNIWPILDELHLAWGRAFRVGYASGYWRASRIDGTGEPLRALSPDDLIAKMRAVTR